MLSIGTKAPEFTLEDKDGNKVSMSDFKGKSSSIFYPKDNTPGCTRQACALEMHMMDLKGRYTSYWDK